MKPLSSPFDRIAAGQPAAIDLRGPALLGARLLNKDLAFPTAERDAFALHGLLPKAVLDIGQQVELELERLRRKTDELEQYIGLAALQDRNATLFYRLLAEHLEEFLPIVYTPTVGRATQEFSHILRRTRGLWITPDEVDRVPELLRNSPYDDVRLIVVTDNERILGLGDQGAGGMAIPIGKLALYTATSGIHPSLTLPVSLDVGTDNVALLDEPLYVGHRQPRLRGEAYDRLVEAFVAGVEEVWPGCLIQWEDFKQHNALRLLDRYAEQAPSFNDDIQGTAAVVLGGLLAATRHLGRPLGEQRVVVVGAGAAGIGIARLLRLAGIRLIAMVDSRGLIHTRRNDLDETKAEFAIDATARGDLASVIEALRPTVLIGATGVGGSFDEVAVRMLAAVTDQPIILALSNPTSASEVIPTDALRWTDGRALVATGSPFAPVALAGGVRVIAQANNVFVFAGLGLGAIAAEATRVTDQMFLVAAEALADHVGAARFAQGAIYPPVEALREVSRSIAVAVAREAIGAGVAGVPSDCDVSALIDAAAWWPDYVAYLP